MTLRAALLLMTYVATAAGTVAVAAHQVAFTIWMFLALTLDAVAIAGQAIVGRYLGAGRRRRHPGRDPADGRVGRARPACCSAWCCCRCARPFVPLFTDDPAVRSLLADVLVVAAVAQPVCGVVFALDGVLIGAGDGRYLAWAGVGTLLAFAPLALLVLAADGGLVALWWAFDGFLLARLLTLVPRWLGGRWMVTGATLPAR